MLVPGKVAQALEGKRGAFRQAIAQAGQERTLYRQALDDLLRLSPAEIEALLAGEAWPGARPLEGGELIRPFLPRWDSMQAARVWALETLRGIPTVAVDGSQIAASKEFGVPVSLVQVAHFENYHDPDRPYVKDVRNEILTLEEREGESFIFAESRLDQHRFALEMRVATERLATLDPALSPLLLIDGSLVLSFTSRMLPAARDAYLQALFGLLDAAQRGRVPVVGYIDLSFAADLAGMLRLACSLPPAGIVDAQLLAGRMAPLDRSAVFTCARGDVLPHYQGRELCFLYLQTSAEALPARLDIPRWVIEAGLLERVVETVRAEIVVGGGYPYAIETADAAAVLTAEDRMQFYRLFHGFARQAGFEAALPNKSISKAHRR